MKKILAVDDMKGWRDYHVKTLAEIFPHQVVVDTAPSARAGYERVYATLDNPYDLVITDLQMESEFEPDYAGEWLVRQIKLLEQYKNTKIIIVSATYNIHSIAKNLGVICIPKSTASQHSSVYKNILD